MASKAIKKKVGLGKGLADIGFEDISMEKGGKSIYGENILGLIDDIQSSSSAGSSQEIKISEIRPNPYQPRKVFDEKAIDELAESIREHGVFTPILVRKSLQGYQLIAGERRTRASQKAGLKTIPAIVVEFDDTQMMEISILENIQREDLNAIEEANALQNLMEKMNYTQEECAKRIGKSREYVANILRLLKLPVEVQQYVSQGKLSMGQVRPLIPLEDETMALELAEEIVHQGLSARAVEKLVKEAKQAPTTKKKEKKVNPYLADVAQQMQSKLQTKVQIDKKKIEIYFSNDDDLNRILELLGWFEEA